MIGMHGTAPTLGPAEPDEGEEEEGPRVMDDDLFSSLQGLTETQVHELEHSRGTHTHTQTHAKKYVCNRNP